MKSYFSIFLGLLLVCLGPSSVMAGAKDDPEPLLQEVREIPVETTEESISYLQERSMQLYQDLQKAYETNPELKAARAELKAVEEQLPQALAGFQPTITGSAEALYEDVETNGSTNNFTASDDDGVSKQAGVDITQPIFRGGRTLAATRAANNLITGQQASLRALEQDIFVRGATAYMDVLRDQAVVNLRINNQALIARQLEATQDRFTVGELTRTDVSQAQARLAGADADLIEARADLRESQSRYENIIGQWPADNLLYPRTKIVVPPNLEEILTLAINKNPEIVSSEYLALAADDNVDEIFGELLPTLNAVGTYDKFYDPVPNSFDDQQNISAGLRLSVPFYQAGSVQSRVREARQTANQRIIEITESKRSIRAQTIAAWEALKAAEAQIISRKAQVEAAAIAREGVNYETEFGERTVLDSLDAEQEYLDAQVDLVTARRDEVVARFELVALMGMLSPETLAFSTSSTAFD